MTNPLGDKIRGASGEDLLNLVRNMEATSAGMSRAFQINAKKMPQGETQGEKGIVKLNDIVRRAMELLTKEEELKNPNLLKNLAIAIKQLHEENPKIGNAWYRAIATLFSFSDRALVIKDLEDQANAYESIAENIRKCGTDKDRVDKYVQSIKDKYKKEHSGKEFPADLDRYAKQCIDKALSIKPAGKVELPAAKEELPAAKEELPAAKEELPAAKKELPAAKEELPAAKEELPAAKKELPAVKEKLPAAKGKLPAAKKELPAAKEKLPAAKGKLPAAKKELPAAKKELPAAKEKLPVEKMAELPSEDVEEQAESIKKEFIELNYEKYKFKLTANPFRKIDFDRLFEFPGEKDRLRFINWFADVKDKFESWKKIQNNPESTQDEVNRAEWRLLEACKSKNVKGENE